MDTIEVIDFNTGEALSLSTYIHRTTMRINEIQDEIKRMKKISRMGDRSNLMLSRIELREKTLEANVQLLNALINLNVLPRLLQ